MINTSTLTINFNQLNDVTGTARSLSKKLSKRADDYSGIKRNISGISTSRNNLYQSNYYIEKKIQKLQDKADKIDNFSRAISDFRDDVKQTDKRVARRIKDDTKSFKKANDINVSVFSYIGVGLEDLAKAWFGRDFVNMFKSAVRSIKYEIKDWYHDRGGKYYVHLAGDIVCAAIAVAAIAGMLVVSGGSAAAFFFAGFAAYKALADYQYDIAAINKYNETGNRVLADRLDDSGGRELTCKISGDMMEGIAILFEQDKEDFRKAGESAAGFVYGGVEIASLIYGINSMKNFVIGKDFSFKNFFKDLKTNAQSGNLKFQDVFLENVKSGSIAKIYKDYKIQSVFAPEGKYVFTKLFNAGKITILPNKWDTFEHITGNFETVKKYFEGGVLGKKTYLYPIKFEEKLKKSIADMSNSIKRYNMNATRITPLQISI